MKATLASAAGGCKALEAAQDFLYLLPMAIDTLIFDIDHTLYPYSQGIENWFADKIGNFVAQEFDLSQKDALDLTQKYYLEFGATLPGLLYHHDIDAKSYYDAKGAAPLEHVDKCDASMEMIHASSKRKIAFTNASEAHGHHILAHLGLSDEFDAVYGLDTVGYWGKPFRRAFDYVFADAKIDPLRAAFFEDSPRNLHYPHSLGMTTVLIGESYYPIGQAPIFVHHHHKELKHAIEAIETI